MTKTQTLKLAVSFAIKIMKENGFNGYARNMGIKISAEFYKIEPELVNQGITAWINKRKKQHKQNSANYWKQLEHEHNRRYRVAEERLLAMYKEIKSV